MTPSGTVVRVLVELGPDVRVPPQTAVYVFAREPGGSPMPVAVRRLTAAELPTVVTLDDTSAMQAGRNLSSAPRVEIVARVSRSGSVTPGPGDVEGISPPLQPKSQTQVVGVLVDKVRR
jgi:cytochrome c-type biogenesis protein CcmH